MLRFTRSLHSAAARQLHQKQSSSSACAGLQPHASSAVAASYTAFPCAAAAAARTTGTNAARLLHTTRVRMSDDVPDHQALKAAHQERIRKKREAEAEAKRLEELANPTPAAAEGEGQAADAGATATDAAAAGKTISADDAATPRPTQFQVNRMWRRLKQEMHYINEHLASKRAPEKRAKLRPTVVKSSIPLREWSQDPHEAAKAQAKEEAKEEEEKEKAEAEEAKVEVEYTGPTALEAVDTETMWDKRIGAMKERLRFLGVAVPKKLVRAATNKNEALAQQLEKAESHLEEVRERWETSQDPRVWRMRDMVEKVAGESETGVALGQIMETDPNWNYLDFLKEMEETMIPEVIHAFRLGDMKLLKSVCEGDAARAMFASFRAREEQKVDWDPRILDVRGVDVVKASVHEDVPFIHLTFVCQHVAVEYDAKTGEVKDPTLQSVVQNTYYSWAIKRDYESPYYDWKIFEFHYQHIQALI